MSVGHPHLEDVQRMSRGCPEDVQRMSRGCLQDIQARGFQRMSYRHPLDVRRNPPDSCRNPQRGFQRMSRGCPEDVQWTSFGLLWMWMSCRHPTDVHWTSYRHPLDILQTSSGRLQESYRFCRNPTDSCRNPLSKPAGRP